jgi:carbon-monoxide dehydrogenase medium subunit
MKPAPFEYLVPDSLDATLAILDEHGGEAKLLAGGQSLVPAMNFRLLQPTMLVDLNNLTELNYIQHADGGGLRIGAMTRQSRLEHDPLVAGWAPLLHEAVPHIAHPQIRNRGTLGGSLAHADPAAELPVICVALDARFRIRSQDDERWIPAAEFFYGMFTTDLAFEEILVEVALPLLPANTGWSFLELARRRGDYAMMGVAVVVTLDEANICQYARLVYLNAGDGPVNATTAAELLQGEAASPAVIEAAAVMAAEQEIDPLGGIHTPVAFQRHLAHVLTRRALQQAFDRAHRRASETA